MKQRDYSKWYTPDKESDYVVSLAEIKDGQNILDPSAGTGNLPKAVHRANPYAKVDCVEIQWRAVDQLRALTYCNVMQGDFGTINTGNKEYDRVIANPPFNDDLWYSHLMRMWSYCKFGGIIVCIIPKRFILRSFDAKQNEVRFRRFLDHCTKIQTFPLANWAYNSDGTYTEIEIIKWIK